MEENGDYTYDQETEETQVEEVQEQEEQQEQEQEQEQDQDQDQDQEQQHCHQQAENESESTDAGDGEDLRKLFVRGLNWNTKADALKSYCAQYGEVEKCEIKTQPNGHSRGFAFVLFKDKASVTGILGEQKHELDSRTIEMKLANKREVITKVFVGGLSKEASDEQIRTHFEQFGKICEIDLPMDANGHRRGFCFINYETEDGLKLATAKRMHTINGKESEVKKTQPKGRGQMRGSGDGPWRGNRGGDRGFGRGGYNQYGSGYGGGYQPGGYGYDGYDYYGGGYGGGWGYDNYGGGGYGGSGGYGGQQSNFGKQRGRGRGGFRPY